jgi:hypothetical protein
MGPAAAATYPADLSFRKVLVEFEKKKGGGVRPNKETN